MGFDFDNFGLDSLDFWVFQVYVEVGDFFVEFFKRDFARHPESTMFALHNATV